MSSRFCWVGFAELWLIGGLLWVVVGGLTRWLK